MTSTGSIPAVGQPAQPEPPLRDRLLRDLLGERRLGLGRRAADRFWGVFGALIVTAIAAGARLWELGRPGKLVFDETYYVKEGWSLASLGFEAAWPEKPNPAFEGAWAWFRLVDSGQMEREANERYLFTLKRGAREARLRVEADSVRNPFGRNELQRFRCE